MQGGIRIPAAEGATPIRALLVDDHQMFLDSLVRAFRDEADIEVVGTAGTLADGLREASERRPDVVVMDLQLPDGDGIEGARRLLDLVPRTTVLLLTGDDDRRVVARAIEAGCMGFLTKGRAIIELLDAVRALAAGDAYVPGDLLADLLPRVGQTSRGVGSDLTARELDVLRLAAGGKTNQAIADALYLSVNTIRNHVQNAIAKLDAHSKLEAVTIALREQLIDLPGGS